MNKTHHSAYTCTPSGNPVLPQVSFVHSASKLKCLTRFDRYYFLIFKTIKIKVVLFKNITDLFGLNKKGFTLGGAFLGINFQSTTATAVFVAVFKLASLRREELVNRERNSVK